MELAVPYALLANAVLVLHVAVVLFVVGGLVLVVAGNLLLGWAWVNALWFRLLHLATIACVAVQAWAGLECPLTTLEMWLRAQGGGAPYAGGFVQHWLQALLFWHGPPWVFTAAYTGFGLAVAVAWWRFPARRRGRRSRSADNLPDSNLHHHVPQHQDPVQL